MSGPKVVRVVTKAELVAICTGDLIRLEIAISEWLRIGKRNETIDKDDEAAVASRLAALRGLLKAEQFTELQKQAPAEISYLASDTARRLERAATQAAEKRSSKRRLTNAARTIALELKKAGLDVPDALRDTTRLTDQELESAVGSALRLVPASSTLAGVSAQQKLSALALGTGEQRQTLENWRSAQDVPAGDGILEQLERHISELDSEYPEIAKAFELRLSELELLEPSPRLQLLADSLSLDISTARKIAHDHRDARYEMSVVKKQLEALALPAAVECSRALAEMSDSTDVTGAKKMLDRANGLLANLRETLAQQSRRDVLLSGLSDLGYEVREGMETAWVKDGRVVLQKPGVFDYGVEVGGNPSAGVQIRTVAFAPIGTQRTATKDVEAETEFCGEFAKLKQAIHAGGGEIKIVKALGVGTSPLRVVPQPQTVEEEHQADVAKPVHLKK